MTRQINNVKNVVKYLEKRYGGLNRATLGREIEVKKKIISDHTLEELKMFRYRVDKSIELSNTPNPAENLIGTVFATASTFAGTFLLAFITFKFKVISNYADTQISILTKAKEKVIENQEVVKRVHEKLDSYDSIFMSGFYIMMTIFGVMSLYWTFYGVTHSRKLSKKYIYSVILNECIDEKEA
jgi:hypothetical protein